MNRSILIVMLVLLVPAILLAQISWTEHNIANDFYFVYGLFATDLDIDGDVDILGTSNTSNCISWWKNEGGSPPTFTEHIIDSFFDGAHSVYAIDINGDSAVDVLGAAHGDSDITWWENDGNENFTKHVIDSLFDGAICVYAIDIEPDGDVDVLGTASGADDITWWENDGNENFTKHTIKDNFDGANCVYAIDIEPDGDVDILGTASSADDITWWENDGSEGFTEHTIKDNFDGAKCVYAIDLDDDGDMDVLGAATYADDITWWENDGNESFTEHVIDSLFDGATCVYAIDMDNDTDIDILGSANNDYDITWWENDGNESFTEHTIDGDFSTPKRVYAIDLDYDSDVDVLGGSQSYVTWWESDFADIHDVGTISIDIPSILPPDTTLYPKATVKNFGTYTEDILVKCEIDPGDYTSNYPVNNLEHGDSIQVTFADSFAFVSGPYTVTVYTVCPFSDDENPANDTLEKVIQTTGIAEGGSVTPALFSFKLQSNPISGKAIFNLALPKDASVTLEIYDVSGRLIDIPLKDRKSSGNHTITWTPSNNGIYFYTFESLGHKENGKLVILR